ncbi:hypothetical protein JTB14_017935 [Gonioctena quinquepunctata]|nr:hypothetical protein JTB14_017935 [Gonioctena quinquepunctata]
MRIQANQNYVEQRDFNRTFPGRILPNEDFSKRIKNVWEGAFKSEYLISGFRSTGLFPVSFNKFPDDGYDPIKLKRFKSSTDIENVPNQQEQVENQNPEPPAFEDFIRTKLTENLAKKAPEKKNKGRKYLTKAKAMEILKEKYDQESNRNTSDVPSSSGEQARKKKPKKISRKNSKRKSRVLSTSSESDVDESEIILESEFEVESEVAVSEKGDSTDGEETLAFQNEIRDKINIEIGDFVEVNFTYNHNTKKEIVKTFLARVLDSNCRNKFEVSCLRNHTVNMNSFVFPQNEDICLVDFDQIKSVLPAPFIVRGIYTFGKMD